MTPAETAAAMVADPAWRFTDDPINAVSTASTNAAEHFGHGRQVQAALWTEVGLRLVIAADNPYITVGASLGELAQTLGVTVS